MSDTLFAPPQPVGEGQEKPKPIHGGKRWIEIPARDQMSFEARRVEDFVPQDAPVRVIDEIIDHLEFGAFEDRHPGGGRPAYHPRLLAKIIIYGMCIGVLRARELSRRLERDLHFMWLASEVHVDHEVLSRFRTGFEKELKDLFRQTVRLGIELGLVKLGCIAIDGTKLATSAGRAALNKQDAEKVLAKIDELIERLLKEAKEADAADDATLGPERGDELSRQLSNAQALREKLQELLPRWEQKPKERISVTDPEAPLQKTQDGKRPGYNGQIAVDDQVGFVVAADVTTDQNDTQQFEPLAKEAIDNLGAPPKTLVADSGYQSEAALNYLAANPELNAYINQRCDTSNCYALANLAYNAEEDYYICPCGKRLIPDGTITIEGRECKRYRAETPCTKCEQRPACYSGKGRYRRLTVVPHAPLLSEMRQRVQSDEGKQALRTRGSTVERVFGMIKAQLGLRQLLTRGLHKAQCQFLWAVLAVNIRKLVNHVQLCGWAPAAQNAAS